MFGKRGDFTPPEQAGVNIWLLIGLVIVVVAIGLILSGKLLPALKYLWALIRGG